MSREFVPRISMERSANYVTQSRLWDNPTTKSPRASGRRYASGSSATKAKQPAAKKVSLKQLILNNLMA